MLLSPDNKLWRIEVCVLNDKLTSTRAEGSSHVKLEQNPLPPPHSPAPFFWANSNWFNFLTAAAELRLLRC